MMRRRFNRLALIGIAAGIALPGAAFAEGKLDVTLGGVENGRIADKYAFCVPATEKHVTGGQDVSPPISWTAGPDGTKSYAIIVVDPDVPGAKAMDKFNKEDQTLTDKDERQDFYHWVLVDIPATMTSLAEGADTGDNKKGGKPLGETDHGVRGSNDYALYMVGDMVGDYGGYDGPCPPWNDELVHHYHFQVYALDVATLGLSGGFSAPEAIAAMKGHILAEGEAVAEYTVNPSLR